MSGEHYECFHYKLEDMADKVRRDGKRHGFEKKTLERFEKCAQALELAANMLNRVDWLLSDDDSEESFHTRWDQTIVTVHTEWDCKVAEQAGYDRAIAEVASWLRYGNSDVIDIASAIEAGEHKDSNT